MHTSPNETVNTIFANVNSARHYIFVYYIVCKLNSKIDVNDVIEKIDYKFSIKYLVSI